MQRGKYLILITLIIGLLLRCSSSTSNPSPDPVSCDPANYVADAREKILIVVVENNNITNPTLDKNFTNQFIKPFILNLFANLFNTDVNNLQGLTLSEILDQYGEPKMIADITAAATGHYSEIQVLTDADATVANFAALINNYNSTDHAVDVIFDLHANTDQLYFIGGGVAINDVIGQLNNPSTIRAIYQTCCYGSSMITEWTTAGVTAVNGAQATNSLVFFSPSLFLDDWINGEGYQVAVQNAFIEEPVLIENAITKANIPAEIANMILTDEALNNSKQLIGGDGCFYWE